MGSGAGSTYRKVAQEAAAAKWRKHDSGDRDPE